MEFPLIGAVVVVIVTRPLPRDWGMAVEHGIPESRKLSSALTRGYRVTESRQKASDAKSP